MENVSSIIIQDNSHSIPEQKSHNVIFMVLQMLFTLPLSIIIIAVLYSLHKKNSQILNNFNDLTLMDIKQVEKKYRRYFAFRTKQLIMQSENINLT